MSETIETKTSPIFQINNQDEQNIHSFEEKWIQMYLDFVRNLENEIHLSFGEKFYTKISFEKHFDNYLYYILPFIDEWGTENWDYFKYQGDKKKDGKMKKFEVFHYSDYDINVRYTTLLRKLDDLSHDFFYTPLNSLTIFTLKSIEEWKKNIDEFRHKKEILKLITENPSSYIDLLEKRIKDLERSDSSSSSSSSSSEEEDIENKKEFSKKKSSKHNKKDNESPLENLKELENTSIGKLAEQISKNIDPTDLESIQKPEDFMNGLMGMVGKMMNPNANETTNNSSVPPIEKIMGQVFNGLNQSLSSGEIKQEDLMKDAQKMMGTLLSSSGSSGSKGKRKGKKSKNNEDPMMNMMSSMLGNMMGNKGGQGGNPMATIFQQMMNNK